MESSCRRKHRRCELTQPRRYHEALLLPAAPSRARVCSIWLLLAMLLVMLQECANGCIRAEDGDLATAAPATGRGRTAWRSPWASPCMLVQMENF